MAQDEDADTLHHGESENQSGQSGTPPADADTETNGSKANNSSEVEILRKQVETLEQRYKDVQGWGTKTAQEKAELSAKLDLLQSQISRNVSAEQAGKEQDDFDKKWREEIDANPSKSVYFFRGLAKELRDSVVSDAKREIERLNAALEETRQSIDPAYQQNREAVDRLVKDYGLDRKTAMAIAVKELKVGGQSQQRASIPGRTAGGAGGFDDEGGKTTPMDAGTRNVARLLGITDPKAIARIQKQ
jgi:hypothetical protein